MNEYSTSSLSLAAAIYTLSPSSFSKISRRVGSNKADFIFNSQDFDKKIISQFWTGKLMVSASNYFEGLKRLKSLLYEMS